jgi:hypothetical protein
MKLKRVLIIDPVTAKIVEADWEGDFEQLYKWMRCTYVTPAPSPLGVLWVDEDATMKGPAPKWFLPEVYPLPITGAAVLELNPSVTLTVEEVYKAIKWGLLMGPDSATAPGKH